MALPILPFVAGAVAGGIATLIYKDEEARKAIKKTRTNVSDKTRKTRVAVSNKMADSLSKLSKKLRTEEQAGTVKEPHTGENTQQD